MVPKYKIHIAPIKRLLYPKSSAYDHNHCAAILMLSESACVVLTIP